MRRVALLLALAPGVAAAQETTPTPAPAPTTADDVAAEAATIPDFDKLRSPDSPAFVILGVAPTQIQRPTSPRELSVVLGSFVSAGQSVVVPSSLAVEATPYWMFSHPYLTADDMTGPGAAWRNFAISLGSTSTTVKVPDGMGGTIDASMTDLALGLRTRIVDGTPRATCWADVDKAAQGIAEKEGEVIATKTLEATKLFTKPDGSVDADGLAKAVEGIRVMAAEESKADYAKLSDAAKKCVEASASRTGWLVDVALAGAMRFPGGEWSEGKWSAAGAWATVAKQGETWSGVALVRGQALHDIPGDRTTGALDVGIQAVYASKRFGIAPEFIYRRLFDDQVDKKDLIRADLTFEVLIAGGMWVSASFARDFAAPDAGQVLALANVKWGFGEPKVKVTK